MTPAHTQFSSKTTSTNAGGTLFKCSRMAVTEVVKIDEKLQEDISNPAFIIKRPLFVKSYPKFSHLFVISDGFLYDNLKWYLINRLLRSLSIILYTLARNSTTTNIIFFPFNAQMAMDRILIAELDCKIN